MEFIVNQKSRENTDIVDELNKKGQEVKIGNQDFMIIDMNTFDKCMDELAKQGMFEEKKKEDNWNLADTTTIEKDGDWVKCRSVKDVKTFLEKVREDDVKSEEELRNSEHTEQYKKGYLNALDDTNQHRKNRAGDL